MRLWSLHPRHLDTRGLVALWREGLLARAVLAGATRGYRHHPQLARFRARRTPLAAIDSYLSRVLAEARARGHAFDASKITIRRPCTIAVTAGQLAYEWDHLARKLAVRDPDRHAAMARETVEPHPCFAVVPGPVEAWEVGVAATERQRTARRRHSRRRTGRRRNRSR